LTIGKIDSKVRLVKRKVLIVVVLLLISILISVTSYYFGAKSNCSFTENKQSAETGLTPTVTLGATVAATESSKITPIITLEPSVTLTPTSMATTPTKAFIVPPNLLRRIPTATPTPTPTPTPFQIQNLRTE
jgi:Kef-type K+ transport system membrane component KefB